MKIVSVETYPLEAPLDKPVERARQALPFTARRALVVKITTDDGVSGYGEGLTPLAPRVAQAVVRDVLTPLLIGRDPMRIEPIWESLYAANSSRGYTRGYQMIAISAVDIALWDLKGKILDQPVYNLLGGAFTKSLPVYATGLMLEGNLQTTLKLADTFYERGLRAVKLKIGADSKRDLEIVQALREHFGPDFRIMVDANGAYDAKTAIRVGRRYDALDVFWFEEPVSPEDPDGLAEVRSSLDMYVTSGECEYTKFGFRDLFLKKAIDVCQPNVSRAGGITECKKIASLAHSFNVLYAPQAWGGALCIAATSHLVSTLPNFLMCEFDQVPNPLRDELLVEPLHFEGGYLRLSERPGLGVEVDEDALRCFSLKS
jgi:D-galactarolactone cycloisomerase